MMSRFNSPITLTSKVANLCSPFFSIKDDNARQIFGLIGIQALSKTGEKSQLLTGHGKGRQPCQLGYVEIRFNDEIRDLSDGASCPIADGDRHSTQLFHL